MRGQPVAGSMRRMDSRPHPNAVGPYRVVRFLGAGGLAQVYEVEAPDDGRRLALKLLAQGGLAVERFAQEYRLLAMMDHRSVVPALRYGAHEDGRPWFTMPLIDGQAAQSYVRARGRPGAPKRMAAVIRVARSVAEALAHVHACRIVHRDVKSSNVLVPRGGRACLIDFGTACDLRHRDVAFVEGEFVGTHAYAPPEQQAGGEVDGRADLYALGVLLYRLASGRRPFDHDDPHRLALLHLRHEPERLDRVVGGVPAELARLVAALMEKRPEDRPASAEEVAGVLAEVPVRTSARRMRPRRARLIGRAQEERTLSAALERPRPGRMLLVTGPLGAGRKRLVETVLDHWRDRGWEVRTASLQPGSEGLGDLVGVARVAARGLRGPEGSALQAALPRLADPTVPAEEQDRLWLEVVTGELRSRGRPTVLGLWGLGSASERQRALVARLRELAREEDLVLVLLATALRTQDSPRGALRRAFPDASRVELGPLGRAQVAGLIGELLDVRQAVPELVQGTWRATGGLPGLVEVVASSLEEQPGSGAAWLRQGWGALSPPEAVADIFRERVALLGEEERSLLLCLAIAGEPVSAEVLAAVLQWPDERVGEVLEALAQQGYVRPEGACWDVGIGLAARVLLDSSPQELLDPLRLRLARRLPAKPPRPARVRLLLSVGWREEAAEAATELACARSAEGRLAEVLPLLELVARGQDRLPPGLVRWLATCRLEVGRDTPRVRQGLEVAATPLEEVDPAGWRALGCLLAAREPDPGELEAALGALRAEGDDPHGELEGELRVRRGQLDRAGEEPPVNGAGAARWVVTRAWLQGSARLWREPGGQDLGWWEGVLRLRVASLRGEWTLAQERARAWLGPGHHAHGRVPLAWYLAACIDCAVDLYRLGEAREQLGSVETLVGVGAPTPLGVEVERLAGRLHLAERRPERAAARFERGARRARRWGLELAALRLEGWLGRARVIGGDAAGIELIDASIAGLLACGAEVLAVELWGLRSGVAEAAPLPAVVRGRLDGVVDRLLLRPLALGMVLRQAERAWEMGDQARARRAFGNAHERLEQLQALQGPGDRAALDAHPWRVRIRRGLTLA